LCTFYAYWLCVLVSWWLFFSVFLCISPCLCASSEAGGVSLRPLRIAFFGYRPGVLVVHIICVICVICGFFSVFLCFPPCLCVSSAAGGEADQRVVLFL